MATPLTLDFDSLLTPVSDEQPTGPELRSAVDKGLKKLYLAVRDARKKAIDAERRMRDFASMSDEERKGEPGAPDPPDWEAVRKYSLEALTRSKDLWITAWLIEALIRLDGFAGLRDGVGLALRLCDGFWQDVHPQANEEEGLTTRFAQLAGLDGGGNSEGTLIDPIMNLPITDAGANGRFSLADYKDASELERKAPEIRRRRVEEGAVTMEMFDQAVAETSLEFFQELLDDLEGASQVFVDFKDFLREKEEKHKAAGGQSFLPPSSKIRDALDGYLRLCRTLTKDAVAKREARDAATAGTTVSAAGRADSLGGVGAEAVNVETRQEAFQTLLRVAEYFRRAEPHSPISYALEQAVRWGRMSLPELLSELVADRSAREEIFKRTGITQEPDEK